MDYEELTDKQWQFIKSELPEKKTGAGRPRADDRKVLNGILYVLITGCKWRDIPEKYGSGVTAWRRLKKWQEKGIWQNIMQKLQDKAYQENKLDLEQVSLDSTTVKAKKGAKKQDTTETKT